MHCCHHGGAGEGNTNKLLYCSSGPTQRGKTSRHTKTLQKNTNTHKHRTNFQSVHQFQHRIAGGKHQDSQTQKRKQTNLFSGHRDQHSTAGGTTSDALKDKSMTTINTSHRQENRVPAF